MKAICPECKKAYHVPDAKIPIRGTYARCPNCRHRFFIKKNVEKAKPRKTNPSETGSGTEQRQNRDNQKTLKVRQSKKPGGGHDACPNCGHRQPPAKECAQCGIIFDKYKMLISCPRCNCRQPRTKVCTNCGYEIYKPPKQAEPFTFKTLISDLRQYGISSESRQALIDYGSENLQKTIITTAIVVGIILFIFIFSGRFLLAPLFTADKEIMYQGAFSPCKCNIGGMLCFGGQSILFKLKIGNTGEDHLNNIKIELDGLPYGAHQVYYTVQSLSATNPIDFDPTLTIICDEEKAFPLLRCTSFNNLITECTSLSSLVVECFALRDSPVKDFAEASSLPCLAEIELAPPCLIGDEATFQIESLAKGTLVQLGLIVYSGQEKLDLQPYHSLSIRVKADAKVVNEDPQLSTLIRLYKSIVGTIFG